MTFTDDNTKDNSSCYNNCHQDKCDCHRHKNKKDVTRGVVRRREVLMEHGILKGVLKGILMGCVEGNIDRVC